jgi:hypothetical protein
VKGTVQTPFLSQQWLHYVTQDYLAGFYSAHLVEDETVMTWMCVYMFVQCVCVCSIASHLTEKVIWWRGELRSGRVHAGCKDTEPQFLSPYHPCASKNNHNLMLLWYVCLAL